MIIERQEDLTPAVLEVTRATRFGRVAGYASQAADELCLIVQVETRATLEALEAIAGVEGVDAVSIGPTDLAAEFVQEAT